MEITDSNNQVNTAGDKEETVFEGRIPVRAFFAGYNFMVFLLFGWNLGLLVNWLRSLVWKIKITNQRLVIIKGLISRSEEDLPLYRATDCGFNQSIAGRLVGAGYITVVSEDASAPKLTFPFIKPAYYKEIIRNNVMIERRRLKTIDWD